MNWYKVIKLADKREYLKQQGYSDKIISWAIKLSNKHARWLCYLAKNNLIRIPEDNDKLKNKLKQFEVYKRFMPIEKRDINSYKDYAELAQILEPYLGMMGRREEVKFKEQEGAKILMDEPPWNIVKLTKPEATSKLLRHTEYCIKDPKFFNEYEPAIFYLVYYNDEIFCLVHYETNQFKDKWDRPLFIETRFKIVDLLFPFTGISKENNPYLAFSYARRIIKGRFPEGEKAIAKDPLRSYDYSLMVLKGRFPEGEKVIAKDSGFSFLYAKVIIGGRFPEGEEAISNSKNPYYPFHYAKDVIKGRFPEGEEMIAHVAGYSYNYARDIIKGRFPEGEKAMKNTEYWPDYIFFLDSIGINVDLEKYQIME